MNDWLRTANGFLHRGQACVLITVAYTAGSAPREAGTKMLVGADALHGTIGGGNLEYHAIQQARVLLDRRGSGKQQQCLDLYPLGPMLEQCCGGVVFLQYEIVDERSREWLDHLSGLERQQISAVTITRSGRVDSGHCASGKLVVTESGSSGTLGDATMDREAIARARKFLNDRTAGPGASLHSLTESRTTLPDIDDALLFDLMRPSDFHLVLFGAGHVGRALVSVLQQSLSCRITWVDSRDNVFPKVVPGMVTTHHRVEPADIVEEMPKGCYYLVMTHSHDQDQRLCEVIMRKGDFHFLGLIGSQTKKRRFHKRLLDRGFTELQLLRLTCPVGIEGIKSKEPGAIALSVAAQLLRIEEERQAMQSGIRTELQAQFRRGNRS